MRWGTIVHDINLDSKFAINYLESNDIDDLFKSRLTCQILMRWTKFTNQPKNKIPNLKNTFFPKQQKMARFSNILGLCTWYIWALWNINVFLKRNTVRPLKRRKPEVKERNILVRTGSPRLTFTKAGYDQKWSQWRNNERFIIHFWTLRGLYQDMSHIIWVISYDTDSAHWCHGSIYFLSKYNFISW